MDLEEYSLPLLQKKNNTTEEFCGAGRPRSKARNAYFLDSLAADTFSTLRTVVLPASTVTL